MSPQSEHQWAQEMLPWHVSGRLAATDKDRFEAHLRGCVHCRADLDIERELARRMSATPVVDYAPQASLARLMQRIDRRARKRSWWSFGSRKGAADDRLPRGILLVFAAQGAALAVLAIAVALLAMRDEPAAYRTLSAAPVTAIGQLQVRFSDEASTVQMRATLGRLGARIVDGPSRAGVFVVALQDTGTAEAQAERLRADPIVLFVQVSERAP